MTETDAAASDDPVDSGAHLSGSLLDELPPATVHEHLTSSSKADLTCLGFDNNTLILVEAMERAASEQTGRKLRGGLPNELFDLSGIEISQKSG